MYIGIVNMYGTEREVRYVVNAIESIGYKPHLIDGFNNSEEEVFQYIKKSPIKYWIFSGSAHPVLEKSSTQVPLQLTTLKDKRFMMLCYSMESILIQLGVPLSERKQNVKELFSLTIPPEHLNIPLFTNIKNPMIMRRNHKWYFPSRVIKGPLVEPIASYKGESMIALYKNSTLIQFHPEKSPDGKKLIINWLGLA